MKDIKGFNYLGDVVAVILTATQTNEIFQLVSLVLTIVATGFSIIFTSVRLYFWFKEATKDGKLTEEEIEDGKSIIDDLNKKDGHK